MKNNALFFYSISLLLCCVPAFSMKRVMPVLQINGKEGEMSSLLKYTGSGYVIIGDKSLLPLERLCLAESTKFDICTDTMATIENSVQPGEQSIQVGAIKETAEPIGLSTFASTTVKALSVSDHAPLLSMEHIILTGRVITPVQSKEPAGSAYTQPPVHMLANTVIQNELPLLLDKKITVKKRTQRKKKPLPVRQVDKPFVGAVSAYTGVKSQEDYDKEAQNRHLVQARATASRFFAKKLCTQVALFAVDIKINQEQMCHGVSAKNLFNASTMLDLENIKKYVNYHTANEQVIGFDTCLDAILFYSTKHFEPCVRGISMSQKKNDAANNTYAAFALVLPFLKREKIKKAHIRTCIIYELNDSLDLLLKQCPDLAHGPYHHKGSGRNSPLECAIAYKSLRAINILCKNGASVYPEFYSEVQQGIVQEAKDFENEKSNIKLVIVEQSTIQHVGEGQASGVSFIY
jgi:hypothetical protein